MRFISVTKPGIIFGNMISLSGAFFLGSQGHPYFWKYIIALLGMSLAIACGCVLNNLIDKDIDQLMERTKNRVIVKGLISEKVAYLYASILGISGILLLYFFVNLLTSVVALIGLFIYVIIYSLYAKRKSILGTYIGAIAGAIPPVVGYCAATQRFDIGAIIVFCILFFWQIPHSYAIAIYRLDDYRTAAIPVMPVRKSILATKVSMLFYTIIFAIAAIMPTVFGYTGTIYLSAALCVGIIWALLAIQGFSTTNNRVWARKMFIASLINITLLSIMMS